MSLALPNTSSDRWEQMKICTVVGARPQFIKLWPLAAELERRGVQHIVVHTGQHFDDNMSQVFFSELGMSPPSFDLELGGLSPAEGTGRMISELGAVLRDEPPDLMVVFGDTNSTLAAAIAANKTGIRTAHIEAGLRSFDRRMPEENNRVLTDHVSDLLFCPTPSAVAHLANEGITRGVSHVGDIMYDAALLARGMEPHADPIAELIGDTAFALATVHRAQSTESAKSLGAIVDYLTEWATKLPIVLPIHPRTAKAMAAFGLTFSPNVKIVEPLSYLQMARATAASELVITDSGGLQKEAYFHRTPCVTLRPSTEWTETITNGWNRLWTEPEYQDRRDINDYGQGNTSQLIVDAILHS